MTVVNASENILDDSIELHPKSSKAKSKGHKPNKIWVIKGSYFGNSSFLKNGQKTMTKRCIQHTVKENLLLLKNLLEL